MKNKLLLAFALVVLLIGAFFLLNAYKGSESNNSGSQGKLDINVICEGALAYTTFPDGESADKFVAECKEGKHPEVIERYKQDNNLDGAKI